MNSEKRIGHYQIVEELGRGGMGVVYKAFEESLDRYVAIKMLSEQLADRPDVVERFKREAKSMGALSDPHIIQVYFIGEQDGQPYFVMEFVEGESLSQRMKREGRIPVKEAMRILRETASGLASAHDRGVIHRDIKPGNLMLDKRNRIRIADFGIAMIHDFGDRLTRTGEFVGTPGYLSPEVCTGKDVDQRSDIFALGIVLYEMLTGDLPFTESSPLGMMLEVVQAEIPDVRQLNDEVDDRVHRILSKMIAKDPDDRYPDCHELLDELEHVTQIGTSAGDPATMVSGTGPTVAMATPPPEAPAATPKSSQALAESPGRDLAVREQKKSRAVPAIAALLLIALGAGATFAFRDQLFGGDREAEPHGRSAMAARAIQADSQEATPGGDEPAEPGGTPEHAGPAAADPDPPAAQDAGAGFAEPATEMPVKVTIRDTQADSPEVVRDVPAQHQAAAEPRPEPEQVQTGRSQQMTVAKATPPRPVEPRVVVLSLGDPAIAGPVGRMLENRLMGAELDVLDSSFISGLDRVMGPNGVDMGIASDVILDAGGSFLVLAETEYIGETPLQYHGQYSTLYSVNLNVRGYDLAQRRAIGPAISERVDFTSLNAEQKAKEALSPHLARIADAVKAKTRER